MTVCLHIEHFPMWKKILTVSLIAGIAAAGCRSSNKDNYLNKLEEKMKNEQNPLVSMKTNMGEIVIELYSDAAPETVKNFLELAEGTKEFTDPKDGQKKKEPYFNGVTFHRVIDGFMIQGGDRKGDGTGGPGYRFNDEISAAALGLNKLTLAEAPQYQRELQMAAQQKVFQELGIRSQEDIDKKMDAVNAAFQKAVTQLKNSTVEELLTTSGYQYNNQLPSVPNETFTLSMANSGPNTNGSQFFINLADNAFLNGKHTVFGKVLKGREIAKSISKVEKDQRDKPVKQVVIESVIRLKD